MERAMAFRHRHIGLPLVLAAAIAALAVMLAPGTADAAGNACEAWGDSGPGEITPGQARKATLCLLNVERRKVGIPELRRNSKLQAAAQNHSDRMDGTGCFDHECPGEPGLDQRLEGVGYLLANLLRWAYGENIAWGVGGRGTPRQITEAWMNSSGHRANILDRDFREVGVGFSRGTPGDGGEAGGIYTTDFGLRVD
jgi:uncharacterized protein YkwD